MQKNKKRRNKKNLNKLTNIKNVEKDVNKNNVTENDATKENNKLRSVLDTIVKYFVLITMSVVAISKIYLGGVYLAFTYNMSGQNFSFNRVNFDNNLCIMVAINYVYDHLFPIILLLCAIGIFNIFTRKYVKPTEKYTKVEIIMLIVLIITFIIIIIITAIMLKIRSSEYYDSTLRELTILCYILSIIVILIYIFIKTKYNNELLYIRYPLLIMSIITLLSTIALNGVEFTLDKIDKYANKNLDMEISLVITDVNEAPMKYITIENNQIEFIGYNLNTCEIEFIPKVKIKKITVSKGKNIEINKYNDNLQLDKNIYNIIQEYVDNKNNPENLFKWEKDNYTEDFYNRINQGVNPDILQEKYNNSSEEINKIYGFEMSEIKIEDSEDDGKENEVYKVYALMISDSNKWYEFKFVSEDNGYKINKIKEVINDTIVFK